MMRDSKVDRNRNQLDVSVTWDDDGCVLALGGELDIATEELLDDALSSALEVTDHLTVDLGRVSFADWSGVGVLAGWARAAAQEGKRLTVRNCPRSVVRITELLPAVGQVLDCGPTREPSN